MSKIWKKLQIKIDNNSIDEKNHTMWATISTSNKDRDGDVVLQNWDLDNFKNNPVFVNSHKYTDATEVIGKVDQVRKDKNGNLEGKFRFAVEENPKAEVIFKLYAGGFLNAVSAGFQPKEFGSDGEIKESELLEVSAVPIPANAMALAKSKGINVEKLFKTISSARTPDYEGTETTSWEDVSKDLENFIDGYYAQNPDAEPESQEEIPERVEDMPAAMKKWIALKSLLGSADAETFKELSFFPVVNPNTDKLNKGALVAVRSGRGQQADIPSDVYESASEKAKSLLEEEFDVEYEDSISEETEKTHKELKEKIKNLEKELQEIKNDNNSDKSEVVIKAITNLSEQLKVETRSQSDRAEKKRLINKAARNLIEKKGRL